MEHWAFWIGGIALAAVVVGNWLLLGKLMAVSGRFTALVDRAVHGRAEVPDMTADEFVQAARLATAAEFGGDVESAPPTAAVAPTLSRELPPIGHVVFLSSLVAGGFLSAALAGDFTAVHELRGVESARLLGSWTVPALFAGGVMVGFGTRMASGCTSGHGLCGVSRAEPGSLVATVAFFGMGVGVSLLLEWL